MDNGNEWDDKLARQPDLGERIIHVMKNIQSLEKNDVDVGELTETEVKDLVKYFSCFFRKFMLNIYRF